MSDHVAMGWKDIALAAWGLICNAFYTPRTLHKSLPTIVCAGVGALWTAIWKPRLTIMITSAIAWVTGRKLEIGFILATVASIFLVFMAMTKKIERLAADGAVSKERAERYSKAEYHRQQAAVEANRQRQRTAGMTQQQVDDELAKTGSLRSDPYEPQQLAGIADQLPPLPAPAAPITPSKTAQPAQPIRTKAVTQKKVPRPQPAAPNSDWVTIVIVEPSGKRSLWRLW